MNKNHSTQNFYQERGQQTTFTVAGTGPGPVKRICPHWDWNRKKSDCAVAYSSYKTETNRRRFHYPDFFSKAEKFAFVSLFEILFNENKTRNLQMKLLLLDYDPNESSVQNQFIFFICGLPRAGTYGRYCCASLNENKAKRLCFI